MKQLLQIPERKDATGGLSILSDGKKFIREGYGLQEAAFGPAAWITAAGDWDDASHP